MIRSISSSVDRVHGLAATHGRCARSALWSPSRSAESVTLYPRHPMQNPTPRAVLCAALLVGASACAPGAPVASGPGGGSAGGRYQVMIPTPEVRGGVPERDAERVAQRLQGLVSDMPRHTSVDPRVLSSAMRQHGIQRLDTMSAPQLAQLIGAQNVLWTSIAGSGSGLTADVRFIDVGSGGVIRFEAITATDADALAQAIFAGFEQKVEGILQSAACNDYLSSSQFERALTTCEAALEVVPTSTYALYGKATALLELDRNEEALETYRELLAIDDTHHNAVLGAGFAASTLGQGEEALRYYNRYLELNPGDVQVRMTVAGQIAETGDYVSAYEVLGPAMEAEENRDDPEFQEYLFQLAAAAGQRVSGDRGQAEALPYFETALGAYGRAFGGDSARPDASQIRQAIAVNLGLRRTGEAIRLAREATAQYDTVAAIWSQYATALNEENRVQEVVRALTRVIELDPEFENAYIRRAVAYLATGERQLGLADLQRAAQRGNRENVARVLFAEGVKLNTAGQFGEAERMFEQSAGYADATLRSQAIFFQGYMLVRRGEVIARANGSGNVAEARRALDLFQRGRPLIEAGTNPNKTQLLRNLEDYIANQEALIRAGSR